MNIDSGFFYSLLKSKNTSALATVEREWLVEEWQIVYDFVRECLSSTMKAMPDPETVEVRFACPFIPSNESVWFYVNELRERKASQVLEAGIRDNFFPLVANEDPKKNKPIMAAETLMNLGAAVRRKYREKKRGDFLDYYRDIKVRIEDFEKRKARNGMIGIPYPFEPLNVTTSGMINGEVTGLFGETGVGKTWLLLLLACSVTNQGYSAAIFSQEMSPRRLSVRLDALKSGVGPDRFRRGQITGEEEEKLRAYYAILPLVKKQNLIVFGPSDVPDLAAFESTMAVIRPEVDVIFWDSPYLCMRGVKSWEEKGTFVQDLKVLIEDLDIPLILTWQLNRKGEPAFTSSIAQDLDHNFVIARKDNQKDLNQATMWSTKTRDGLELAELVLTWNVAEGRFGVLSWNIPGVGSSTKSYQVSVDYKGLYDGAK